MKVDDGWWSNILPLILHGLFNWQMDLHNLVETMGVLSFFKLCGREGKWGCRSVDSSDG